MSGGIRYRATEIWQTKGEFLFGKQKKLDKIINGDIYCISLSIVLVIYLISLKNKANMYKNGYH